MSVERPALLGKALAAVKWNAIGIAGRVLLQLVVMIVIARAIGPAEFGIFGVCMLAFGLGLLVADLGLGMALVQATELSRETLRAAWGRVLLSHGLIAATLAAGADAFGALLGAPEAVPHLRVMALAVLASAAQPVLTAQLRRALDFKGIQQANLLAYALGFGVCGIGLAFAGAGAWSLVGALLVQQAVLVAVWSRGLDFPWRPRWSGALAPLHRFGTRAVLSNIANWVTENAPSMVVSRFHGALGLGYFNIASNLARTPTNHLVSSLQQVIMSATSRAQDEQQMLGRAYIAVVRAVGLASLPLFLSAAALAGPIIAGLYGPRWSEAAPLFVPLALAMPFHALMAIAGPVLWGRGKTSAELKPQAAVAVLMLAGLVLAAEASLLAKAWTVFALYALRCLWVTAAVLSDLGLPAPTLLRALVWPLALGGATASLLTLLALAFGHAALPAAAVLALLAAAGAALLLLAFRWQGARLLGPELAPLVLRVPARWRPCLGLPAV